MKDSDTSQQNESVANAESVTATPTSTSAVLSPPPYGVETAESDESGGSSTRLNQGLSGSSGDGGTSTDNSVAQLNSSYDEVVKNERGIVFSGIGVNVRQTPDTSNDENILRIDNGTLVDISSELTDPVGWYSISFMYNGEARSGYCSKDYIKTNLPEDNPILHVVQAGETLIDIAENKLKYNIDNRTLVNIIAHMNNSISVDDTREGWKEARADAGDFIFLPSAEYAERAKEFVNSGSIKQNLVDGIAEQFANIGEFLGISELPTSIEGWIEFLSNNISRLADYFSDGVQEIVNILNSLKEMWDFFTAVMGELKDQLIEGIRSHIEGLIAETEAKAREKLREQGVPESHWDGILSHLNPMLAHFKENWWDMVKQGLWEVVWPIPGVWGDVKDYLNNILIAGNHLWKFEFSKFTDTLLDMWGNVNSALGRLSGWISLVLIAVPTIAGAAAGGVGAVPGFMAGLGAAAEFGTAMLISTAAEHAAKVAKGLLSLYSVEEAQDDDEKAVQNEMYYSDIAGSGLTLGIIAGVMAIGAIGAQIGKKIYTLLKKRFSLNGKAMNALKNSLLKNNPELVAEAERLIAKGFSKADIEAFALYIETAFPKVKSNLLKRIESGRGFGLIHSDSQLQVIMMRAKSLKLSAKEVDDLLLVSCRTDKQIPASELLKQMDNWVNVVKARGYPYKFNSASEFAEFGANLKAKLKGLGIDSRDVRVQGSSLRSPAANDIDLAVMIKQADFDDLIRKAYSGRVKKDKVPVDMSKMSHEELVALSDDIFANPKAYNGTARSDFNYNFPNGIIKATPDKKVVQGFKDILSYIQNDYPHLNMDNITIQKHGSGFDLDPYLNLP